MLSHLQSSSYKVKSFFVLSDSEKDNRLWAISRDGEINADIHKPLSAISADYDTQSVCPPYETNDTVYAAWDPANQYWVDLNIDARRMVEHTSCNEFPDKLVAGAGSTGGAAGSTAGLSAGNKGAKGESGVGQKGSSGEQGSKGETGAQGGQGDVGAQGATGSAGAKGGTGAQGDTGDKGDKGDDVDLSSSPIVSIDGVEFGARLMGICVNGEWKYVYIFASTPQTA